MTDEHRKALLKFQQGEMNGVETYLILAKTVHNETDARTFKSLAADEGRHASVFRKYTGEVVDANKAQAYIVAGLYHLLGKKIVYPLIGKGEYSTVPEYKKWMKIYPDIESVKNDEKRHGDTVNALLENGEFNDKAKWPILVAAISIIALISAYIASVSSPSAS